MKQKANQIIHTMISEISLVSSQIFLGYLDPLQMHLNSFFSHSSTNFKTMLQSRKWKYEKFKSCSTWLSRRKCRANFILIQKFQVKKHG